MNKTWPNRKEIGAARSKRQESVRESVCERKRKRKRKRKRESAREGLCL
jgi:hypothetical protein